jgi:hypothetical protein
LLSDDEFREVGAKADVFRIGGTGLAGECVDAGDAVRMFAKDFGEFDAR